MERGKLDRLLATANDVVGAEVVVGRVVGQ